MGDATAHELIGGALVEINLRIEPPALAAVPRVERDDLVEGRAEDERIFDQNRRRLTGGLVHQLGFGG